MTAVVRSANIAIFMPDGQVLNGTGTLSWHDEDPASVMMTIACTENTEDWRFARMLLGAVMLHPMRGPTGDGDVTIHARADAVRFHLDNGNDEKCDVLWSMALVHEFYTATTVVIAPGSAAESARYVDTLDAELAELTGDAA